MYLFATVLVALALGVVIAAIIYVRNTPNKQALNDSHQQMARALDHVIRDRDVRPLLEPEVADKIRCLVADYYKEK